jgi:hypothetical protein
MTNGRLSRWSQFARHESERVAWQTSMCPIDARDREPCVWQRHFGGGIVPTPNDFGTLCEPPSHPELLDWLTRRFLAAGWKMKPLHALIMNSATYRQTARREPSAAESQVDPTNRLLWRFPPQRLDAEQVRDAMLAVSGELQMRDGEESVSGTSPHRSVYVKKLRNRPDEMLGGFDAPLGFESAPDRISTTTPIQSLLLVNGGWNLDRSRAFARRLLSGGQQLEPGDIRTAYQLVFSRDAMDDEVSEALSFMNRQMDAAHSPAVVENRSNGATSDTSPVAADSVAFTRTLNAVTDFCHALFNSNEFLYLH